MSTTDPLVPMWMAKSGIEVLDRMPSRPVIVHIRTLGAVLHGEVVTLTMSSAQVRPNEPLFLWNHVEVVIRFRYADVVYELAGVTNATHPDHSFTFEFDRVTRQRMAVLHKQLQQGGHLQPSEKPEELAGSEAETEAEREPAERDGGKPASSLPAMRRLGPPNGKERRRYERHDLCVEATVQKIGEAKLHKCHLLEIGLGGCRIYTEQPNDFRLGEHVEVRFVGHGAPFRLTARLRFHASEQAAGLEFEQMSARTSAHLHDLLQELTEKDVSPSPCESPVR